MFKYFSVLALLILTACSSQSTIVNDVDESEANEIIVYLDSKGIHAEKVVAPSAGAGGQQASILFNIVVPKEESIQAMSYLNVAGLPRIKGQSLLQIFSNTGLIPSATDEKIRYEQGLAGEIANTIRKIDGVTDANVILSFPEQDPLNPDKSIGKVTAAVFVKHNGILDDPNANLVSKIKRLVSSSIPNLSYDDVTVIGDLARMDKFNFGEIANQQPPQMATVWGINIDQNSAKRFQWLFFSIISIALVSLILFIWLLWKFFPLLKEKGGLRELFRVEPLQPQEFYPEPTETPTVVEKEKEDENEDNGKVT